MLILTARDRWQDKVEGLSAGADDYVAKPFHFAEVQARLSALLRRTGGWASATLACGALELDTRTQAVTVAGAAVELTSFEYRILEHLMLRAGEVISKSELTERLYEQDFDRDSNVVEVAGMGRRCAARDSIPTSSSNQLKLCAVAAIG